MSGHEPRARPGPGTSTSRILVTAFAPFGGRATNTSALVADALAARWAGPEPLRIEILPVSFARARAELTAVVEDHRPAVVLCLGEAGGRSRLGLERVALNLMDARIPDEDGRSPVDLPVEPGGPLALMGSLPVKACFARLRERGFPVEVSMTAGTYVCNATFYTLMHLLAGRPETRGGFVHVPALPEPDQTPGASPQLATSPGREVDALAEAVETVLLTSLSVAEDLALATGRED
ncbi:pyroglutamyl-peptidase I [Actinotalea sp. BY-33]|uniref:Pyroglutamyl-peptidase I n=1 Tax=Actinotalea soli TaxID=2819234 RepID=A0A939LS30_9CELL|nr:pyroglutamyl-peptidase I [Actinotalea soli]MBO1750317.1 pyroglutamyl-peptidase I [Actinotalea soli]